MRILVVEDELKMAGLLKRGLEHEGYAVDVAGDGEDALWAARENDYDAVVLDAMIPGPDGLEVCRTLREEGRWAPVLILTARDGVDDRVAGLDAGADDYLTKPFAFAELFARLRSITRRDLGARPTVLEVNDLRLDPATHQVWRGDTAIALSANQLVNPTGTVIVTSAGKSIAPVLSHGDLDRALRHEVLIDRSVPDLPGLGHRARFLARPVPGPDGPVVIVVGASLDAVERGRHALALAFALACPVLVGVLGAGGWLLAGAALRPVAHMTEEADAISLAEPGRRLLQPLGDDEIAHLARTLNAMLERIEATFARERAFLDDASHELRTPLSILRAELDVALLDTSDIAETRRALRSALEEAERLSQLADDFLILAREAAGRLPLRRQPADLRDLASHVTTRLRWGTVPVVDGGDPVVACVDPARFEQVLANLLANARRHAQQQVRVEVALDQGEAVVTIADDGPGFPPDLIPVVFDRFTTADPVRHRQDDGGAGLGLAIAAALVRAHSGTIEAGNGPPLGGAVVRIRLPAST